MNIWKSCEAINHDLQQKRYDFYSMQIIYLFSFTLSKGVIYSISDFVNAENNSSSLINNQNHGSTTFFTGPYLDGNGISNVTTQISTHAYLPCKVSIYNFQIIRFNRFHNSS